MSARRLLRLAAVGALAAWLGSGAVADPTPKEDGKAFGALLRPQAAAHAKTTPTPETIPGFTVATPPQATYYSNPSNLQPAAAAAASGSVGYQSVTHSIASRATFSKVDLDATVKRGKTVAADPLTYVQGYGATGAPGNCHPLPPGTGASAGTYEATCNAGYTQDPPVTHSCAIPVTPQFKTVNKYECTDGDYAFNHTDSCDPIFAATVCTHTGSRPGKCLVAWGDGHAGCAEPGDPIEQYSCPVAVPGMHSLGTQSTYTGSTSDDTSCSAWKTDTSCKAAPDVCTDLDPATRVISGVSVTQACWSWSRTYTCGGGLTAQNDCSNLAGLGCTFEREDCLSPPGGPCLTVDKVYKCPLPPGPADKTQYICDGDVYCLDGKCDTIVRTPNKEFGNAAVALNAASQAGKEFDPNTLTLFKGNRMTCSKTIFGLSNCCVPRGFPLLGGCNASDQALKVQQEKGLCSLVGSYCSSSFLGICLGKKEAHCCYLSKISRILQEQGRPQIGKPYGDPNKEQCAGFTITEFQQLDLSKMDFSEVYAEFTDAAKLPDELATATSMQTKITDYFNSHPH